MASKRNRSKPTGIERKAVGYCRVSTVDQADNGVSMEAQESRIQAYCELHGLDLVEIIKDNGISGGKPLASREGGRAVLKALSMGEAGNVVTTKLDRAFRSTTDALTHIEAWNKQGVGFHVIDLGGDQSLNTRSATGQFVMTMLAALGELERGLMGERTRAVLTHKRDQRQAYGPTPYGYQRQGDALVDDPGELGVVDKIKGLCEAGLSFRKIADRLNGEGVKTKRGGKWGPSTVWYMVNNELYTE